MWNGTRRDITDDLGDSATHDFSVHSGTLAFEWGAHNDFDDVDPSLSVNRLTFVVLGVVLALGANEWRQSVDDRAESNRALHTILEEIHSNRDAVASFAYRERQLLEAYRATTEFMAKR